MNICPNCNHRGEERHCPHDGFPMINEERVNRRSPEAEFLGRVFDQRYQVLDRLGAGGMGWVFRARHLNLGHEVALKVMRREISDDLRMVKRFFQEARACSQLKHPHTIKVSDFGTSEDGFLYLAMELLEGAPLSAVLAREGPLEPLRVAHIGSQICESLDEAHDLGLIHRDLKPDNIFLCSIHKTRDYVKVLDFGIAKLAEAEPGAERLTSTGMVLGTPHYLSPEQAQGGALDRRSDLFSLGVIFFQMITGVVPFDGPSLTSIMAKIVLDPTPEVPEVVAGRPIPPTLRRLIESLMSKDVANRPTTAEEVGRQLRQLIHEAETGPLAAPAASASRGAPGPVVTPPAGIVGPGRAPESSLSSSPAPSAIRDSSPLRPAASVVAGATPQSGSPLRPVGPPPGQGLRPAPRKPRKSNALLVVFLILFGLGLLGLAGLLSLFSLFQIGSNMEQYDTPYPSSGPTTGFELE